MGLVHTHIVKATFTAEQLTQSDGVALLSGVFVPAKAYVMKAFAYCSEAFEYDGDGDSQISFGLETADEQLQDNQNGQDTDLAQDVPISAYGSGGVGDEIFNEGFFVESRSELKAKWTSNESDTELTAGAITVAIIWVHINEPEIVD